MMAGIMGGAKGDSIGLVQTPKGRREKPTICAPGSRLNALSGSGWVA